MFSSFSNLSSFSYFSSVHTNNYLRHKNFLQYHTLSSWKRGKICNLVYLCKKKKKKDFVSG